MRDPASGAPMTPDAIFRIYSMTNPSCRSALMMLVEDGRIQLSDPARVTCRAQRPQVGIERRMPAAPPRSRFVPARANRRSRTAAPYLRHRYDFFGNSLVKQEYKKIGVDGWDQTNAEMVQKLTKVPLQFQPGTTWDLAFRRDVLGYLIERVTGQSLADYLQAASSGPWHEDTASSGSPNRRDLQSRLRKNADTRPAALEWCACNTQTSFRRRALVSTAATTFVLHR